MEQPRRRVHKDEPQVSCCFCSSDGCCFLSQSFAAGTKPSAPTARPPRSSRRTGASGKTTSMSLWCAQRLSLSLPLPVSHMCIYHTVAVRQALFVDSPSVHLSLCHAHSCPCSQGRTVTYFLSIPPRLVVSVSCDSGRRPTHIPCSTPLLLRTVFVDSPSSTCGLYSLVRLSDCVCLSLSLSRTLSLSHVLVTGHYSLVHLSDTVLSLVSSQSVSLAPIVMQHYVAALSRMLVFWT